MTAASPQRFPQLQKPSAPQTPLQQSGAALQPASLPAHTQVLLWHTPLQHRALPLHACPSSAQHWLARPPSTTALSQLRPTQQLPGEPGTQALPTVGQQPPQRQLEPAPQPAAGQPVPRVGQQMPPSLQLPSQQSELAKQARPGALQLPPAGLEVRAEPRLTPEQPAAHAATKAKASRVSARFTTDVVGAGRGAGKRPVAGRQWR